MYSINRKRYLSNQIVLKNFHQKYSFLLSISKEFEYFYNNVISLLFYFKYLNNQISNKFISNKKCLISIIIFLKN